jgi:DNA-binding NtrC family response regulator
VRITQEALQKIMRYPFPGNVRELENLIEGALALTVDPVIDPGDLLLPESSGGADPGGLTADLPTLGELASRYVARVLSHTKGNMSAAAKILGVDRKTLYRKRDELSHSDTHDDSWDIH